MGPTRSQGEGNLSLLTDAPPSPVQVVGELPILQSGLHGWEQQMESLARGLRADGNVFSDGGAGNGG